jgi:hypothetical protein
MAGTALPLRLRNDSDGIPPGVDMELQGKIKVLTFSGHFYAQPSVSYQRFSRMVSILFASKEIYVAEDIALGNLYVVDRKSNISLGCRMTATLGIPTARQISDAFPRKRGK